MSSQRSVLNLHDRALAERLLAGEKSAFDEFFRGYFPGLYRFALSRMERDADGAEEVVQATLCKAITKLAGYRGEAALFTWLCTFCRHEISAYYEQRRRQPASVDALDDAEALAALESLWVVAPEGPEAALERAELARRVHVTLDHLQPRHAAALEWKYVDGLSVKEIAERLQVSPKAAESVLTRAREAFRDGFAAWPLPEYS
ncbi:MAG TPA: sigma-70 family RNA polymerase sigma factor [Candidatus Polarisedimenticolaceae bacterium]|nr:sigma-70 family RNA polymerase sigma factor [Candidatus Polarisedimenticolaceae bacterium]